MTTPDLPLPAGDSQQAPDPGTLADGARTSSTAGAGPGLRTWALALAAGLATGLIGSFVAESALTGGNDRVRDKGMNVPLASEVGLHDAMVSYGTLGALMGLGLGLAGGWVGRSPRRAALAGSVGLVLGGMAGAGMSRCLVPIFYDNVSAGDMTYSLEVNGGIWGAVGAAAGLAFGLGLGGSGRMLRPAVAGLGAGLVAMALFVFAGSILYPVAMTDRPLSLTPGSRLAGRLLLAVLVAAGVALGEGSGTEDRRP